MKKLIAKGKDIYRETHEFTVKDGILFCDGDQLTELMIPEGVTHVNCWDNQLTELKLPEGVETVRCSGNKLTHLDLPLSVIRLWADKEVTGLDKHIGKVTMNLI